MVGNQSAFRALVPKQAIEALHSSVLHRPAGLNMNQPDIALFAPRQKMAAGKLGPVIAGHGVWHTTLLDLPKR